MTAETLILERLGGAVGANHLCAREGAVIARPGSPAEIVDVVRVAREVGAPLRISEPLAGAIVLDLTRMKNVLYLDETSLLCTVQSGICADALESELGARGLTLGPLPAGSRSRTLGALLAAPRPSEAGPRAGRFVSQVAGLSAVLSDGTEVSTRVAPRKATGPDLNHALLGARGTLGIITGATLRLWRQQERATAAFALPSVEAALATARALVLAGARPWEIEVARAPGPTLQIVFTGPPPLLEAERTLAQRLAASFGGSVSSERLPLLAAARPYEQALSLAALSPALELPLASRVTGFHRGGAALVDPTRSPTACPPSDPLFFALKRRLDPEGRFPDWPAQ